MNFGMIARILFSVAFVAVPAFGCSSAEGSGDAVAVASGKDEVRSRFLGNWELVSFESFPADGPPVDNDYIGRILYDDRGNMSGIGMPRSLPSRAAEANQGGQGEILRAGFAYFSTYEIFPEDSRVVHTVIGSPMNPSWTGTELVRYYEFSPDGLLSLSIRNPDGRVTGTLIWRRLEGPATDQIQ